MAALLMQTYFWRAADDLDLDEVFVESVPLLVGVEHSSLAVCKITQAEEVTKAERARFLREAGSPSRTTSDRDVSITGVAESRSTLVGMPFRMISLHSAFAACGAVRAALVLLAIGAVAEVVGLVDDKRTETAEPFQFRLGQNRPGEAPPRGLTSMDRQVSFGCGRRLLCLRAAWIPAHRTTRTVRVGAARTSLQSGRGKPARKPARAWVATAR